MVAAPNRRRALRATGNSITRVAYARNAALHWTLPATRRRSNGRLAAQLAALATSLKVSMSELFDLAAGKFADDIDDMIACGRYVRGDLFVELARCWLPTGAYVLDYGCGPGRLSALLAQQGLRIKGVDTSAGMIEQARKLPDPRQVMSFQTIQDLKEALPSNAYDAIVCSSVIEYVSDADGLLQHFRQSLRLGGRILISFANASSYFRKRWKNQGNNPMGPAQHHVWTWRQFRELLQRNGFRAVAQPLYYDSPWDPYAWGRWTRRSSMVGSLGVLVADVPARRAV